jgi:hypothetical protein
MAIEGECGGSEELILDGRRSHGLVNLVLQDGQIGGLVGMRVSTLEL